MGYVYLFLLLVHIISGSSSLDSKSKLVSLRSVDPLTRRSSVERNFIRFGRSVPTSGPINVNKRETYDEAYEVEAEAGSDNKNLLFCLFAQDPTENLFCVGRRQNLTDYRIDGAEDDLSNQTETFSRVARANDADRIRKSKGGNFMRLGRGNLARTVFNRFDRGRDNFMRLGRSWDGENVQKFKHDRFTRLGRDDNVDAELERPFKRQNSFMRLGRDGNNEEDDAYERAGRRHDSFMRLGRGGADSENSYHRIARGHENFMRLGRAAEDLYERFLRKHDSFMRLGRNDPLNRRSQRRHDSFMRLGRLANTENVHRDVRRSGNFIRLGRDAEENESSSVMKRSRGGHFERLTRGSNNFMRLGRSIDECSEYLNCYRVRLSDNQVPPKSSCLELLENLQSIKSRKYERVIKYCIHTYGKDNGAKSDEVSARQMRRAADIFRFNRLTSKCEGYQCQNKFKVSDSRQRMEVDDQIL